MQFRQILRALGKNQKGKIHLAKLLARYKTRMTDREFQILNLTYIKKLPAFDVADKLGFSNSHYHNVLNPALAKFEAFIDDVSLREIVDIL